MSGLDESSKRKSKKDSDINDLITSANNKFPYSINSVNKTNNKSIIGNKSGNMSFMKTIDELGIQILYFYIFFNYFCFKL